jgi:hypothetical protein
LKKGGYAFDNKDEAIAKRNAAITLSKNPAFMKVPGSGNIGLAEWYPNAKRKVPRTEEEAEAEELAEKYAGPEATPPPSENKEESTEG